MARVQAALGLARQRTSTALVPELDRIEREADCLNELIGQILITDCGPGVPEPMLDKIFEPFVRVGEARDRQSGGYDLGLAIAHRAIRAHHGAIEARNRIGGLTDRHHPPAAKLNQASSRSSPSINKNGSLRSHFYWNATG